MRKGFAPMSNQPSPTTFSAAELHRQREAVLRQLARMLRKRRSRRNPLRRARIFRYNTTE